MAARLYGFAQFADGSFGSFQAIGASAETSTELITGGTGLNQTSGLSIGSAFEGKTLVACSVQAQEDSAQTAGFSYAYLQMPTGQIGQIVYGGDFSGVKVYDLLKPVVMRPGIKLFGAYDTRGDQVSLASLAVYCASGKADVFAVKAVDATKTSMVSVISGGTVGESLAGETIVCAYATYPANNGLNDNFAGVSGFYIESSDGMLKYMFPPMSGSEYDGFELHKPAVPIKIEQNDTLSVMAGL